MDQVKSFLLKVIHTINQYDDLTDNQLYPSEDQSKRSYKPVFCRNHIHLRWIPLYWKYAQDYWILFSGNTAKRRTFLISGFVTYVTLSLYTKKGNCIVNFI